jgi:branched-chain amino acid transport system substrate-binding protein
MGRPKIRGGNVPGKSFWGSVAAVLLGSMVGVLGLAPLSAGASTPKGTTLLIGQLEDQTGPAITGTFTLGQDILSAWVKWTNAHGGLAGHPVKLITMNDNSDPAQAQSDLNTLVNQDHILALVGQDAETTEPTWDTFMQQAQTPVIGGPAYTTAWFTDSMFYPVGTTVVSNVWGEVYAAAHEKVTKLASLLCNNSTVCLGAQPLIEAASKQLGVSLVYNETASETATDYTPQCLGMKQSGAGAVDPFVNDELLARNCQTQGYHPIWIGANTSITLEQLASTPQLDGLTAPSNGFPWWQQFPATSSFFQAVKKYAPQFAPGGNEYTSEMSSVASLVWASGVVFGNAIKNADVPATATVTRTDVIRGLSKIQNSTNGGYTPPVSYGNGTTPSQQVNCFWLYKVVKSKYVSVNGSKTFCEPLSDLGVKGGTK